MDVMWLARALDSLLDPLRNRVLLMIGRGVLLATSSAAGDHLRVQHGGLPGETLDEREAMHNYGFTCRPHAGAEAIFLCLAGNRSRSVVIACPDARYRLDVAEGEVALYDDLGQRVHLTRAGIVAQTPLTATVSAGPKLRLEADHVEFHAREKMSWDVNGYGWHIRHLGGATWENLTWQLGATMAPVSPLPINPPEGP